MRTSVASNVRALQADTEDRIARYNNLETEDDPAKQTKVLPLLDQDKLNPIFSKFCEDGQEYFSKPENATETQKLEKYQRAIDEYIFMKQKISAELQIMEANRVGVDKNIANIVKQTAGHVGLSMPKQYESDDESA